MKTLNGVVTIDQFAYIFIEATETSCFPNKMPNKEERRTVDISHPMFLKPFDYGWKREVVFRNKGRCNSDSDIYYHTPTGKKLRSLREISAYLIGTDLLLDNFTFSKEAIGCDKEIIRWAVPRLSNKNPTVSSVVEKKSSTPKTRKCRPKLTATVNPLGNTSGLPVAQKTSAAVVPRIIKIRSSSGAKAPNSCSKTNISRQPLKIAMTKASERKTTTGLKLNNFRDPGFKLANKGKPQSENINTGNLVPLPHQSVSNAACELSLTSDRTFLSNANSKRPHSPETQFRPCDIFYGCENSDVPVGRTVRPDLSTSSSPSCHSPFETVLLVDTFPTSESVKSPQCNPSPVPWTNDCSIEVLSVKTLSSKDVFSNDNHLLPSPSRKTVSLSNKQSKFIQAKARDELSSVRKGKSRNNISSAFVGSSSGEISVADNEDNSSHSFLMRNESIFEENGISINHSLSLQSNLATPFISSQIMPETSLSNSHENSSVVSENSVACRRLLLSNIYTSNSNVKGSNYEEFRKFKRERFCKRQKEKKKREKEIIKKLLGGITDFKKKSEEKRLQIEYLRLKLKIKGFKLLRLQRKSACSTRT